MNGHPTLRTTIQVGKSMTWGLASLRAFCGQIKLCRLFDISSCWLTPSLSLAGTYNNQYMVVDLKLFTPGQNLRPGLLTILEQIPGLVIYADQTALLERGYWPRFDIHLVVMSVLSGWSQSLESCLWIFNTVPTTVMDTDTVVNLKISSFFPHLSYNIPFYEEIYNLSGCTFRMVSMQWMLSWVGDDRNTRSFHFQSCFSSSSSYSPLSSISSSFASRPWDGSKSGQWAVVSVEFTCEHFPSGQRECGWHANIRVSDAIQRLCARSILFRRSMVCIIVLV